jgi:ParB/RepB/Spo0J family partition protein
MTPMNIPEDKLPAGLQAKNAIAKASGTASTASKEAPGIVKRSSAYFLDPKAITRREGWNPRFDFGEIEELAKSLKVNGMLVPIRVKRLTKPEGGKLFELVDGDRRLSAVELLLKKDSDAFPEGIPAIIIDKAQDDLKSLIQMFEANTGKPFLPMEEAAAFKRMRDEGMTIADICKAVGRKQMHVQAMLALLDADPEVQEAVQKGEIGKTEAKDIAVHAKGDKAKQKEIVAAAKDAKKDPKNKAKKRIVLKKIDEARQAKAAKQGRTLKVKHLSDEQLAEIGAKLAKVWIAKAKQAGVTKTETDADITKWCAGDDALAAAFTWGALQALKVAAGMKLDLDI